jgi:3-phenylpropionate/trans-cinnamate dioxygenase ferredoxin subunit
MSENGFIKIASTNEIATGQMKKTQLNDTDVLVANIGGTYYAIEDKCPHMQGDLSAGTLEGNVVTCPKHHAKFDLTTGKAVGNPKMGLFHPKVEDAKVFQIKVENQDILIKR